MVQVVLLVMLEIYLMQGHAPTKQVVAVLGLALATRLCHLAWSTRDPLYLVPVIDSATYALDAGRILKGMGFTECPFWQGPLYPLFLAVPWAIRQGSAPLAGLIQCMVGAVSCLMTLWLGRRMMGGRWGASDGNFAAAMGLPVLDGLGAVGGGAHARHEHVTVDGMVERAAVAAAVIAAFCS